MSYDTTTPKGPRGNVVVTYNYGGGVIKRRFENDRKEKSFDWGRQKDALWIPLTDADRDRIPMYHDDVLAAADPERELWICEGEKDADRLHGLGLLATTAPHGVLGNGQSVKPHYMGAVKKFERVAVLEDNDDAGRTHAAEWARMLTDMGTDVRVIRCPGVPEHGDVSDWLAAGHTVQELIEMSERTARWAPPVWPDIDIPQPDPYGPDFPSHHLPSPHREYVDSVARAIDVPKALVATLELSIVGGACAKKVAVRVNESHDVPVNVWAVVGLDSGERKSSTFRESFAPVVKWEHDKNETERPLVAEYMSRLEVARRSLKEAEKNATGMAWDSAEADEVKRLARDLAELEAHPITFTKFAIQDATAMAMSDLLATHGRMMVASPEGIVFDHMAGRFGDKDIPDLNIFLMGYSGDDYGVARISRESVTASRPAISMALTTQPAVIEGLGEHPWAIDRGIVPRFWFAMPEPKVGYRNVGDPVAIDPAARAQRNGVIKDLLNIAMPEPPHVLTFEYDAMRAFLDYAVAVEARLRPDGDLFKLRMWGTRVQGGTARLCGIIHMMKHANDVAPWDHRIDRATVNAAVAIMDTFLIPNAIVAHGAMQTAPESALAMRIMSMLKRWGKPEVTRNDVHKGVRGRDVNLNHVKDAIEALLGWNVLRDVGFRGAKGKKSGPWYTVNPAVFTEAGVA